MSKTHKTWQEKLDDDKDFSRVVEITDKMSKRWGTGTLVIPAPREVEEIIGKMPRGKRITINHIRALLAQRHGATIGCPLTTGIFIGITARAAEEAQAAHLIAEGHTIEPGKGKRPPKVKDFEKALVVV